MPVKRTTGNKDKPIVFDAAKVREFLIDSIAVYVDEAPKTEYARGYLDALLNVACEGLSISSTTRNIHPKKRDRDVS